MLTSHPFFSIIIPTYNRKSFLKHAVDSALKQTFQDFELIVIDDGSTDGTIDLIREYNDPRVRYEFHKNNGPASARNRGLKKAKGEFIAFLDSDDQWVPQKLEKFHKSITQHPDIKIFHSEERWYREGKLHNPRKRHKKPSGYVYPEVIKICCIGISTAVIHRDVFKRVGTFDESMPACEDYDFWIRAAHVFDVQLVPEYLTLKYGGRPDQVSSQIWGLDRFRIQALAKMLEEQSLSLTDYQLTYHEMEKKCQIYLKGAQKRDKVDDTAYYQSLLERFRPSIPTIFSNLENKS